MLQDLTSQDRFYIPDPWDETTEDFVETTTPGIVDSAAPFASLTETSSPQLAPAPVPNAATILLQDELKLRNMEPSFFLKLQEILAHLYWADSICDA
jgi:hypothetical protein